MPQLKLFCLALSFYTRVPSPIALDYQGLPKATVYLPLIGWLVGAITAMGFILADYYWSQASAVILAISVGIMLTGAFHEDGFADACDGFGGGYTKQRILEIMKDSSLGVYGCLGLLLLLLLKVSLLNEAKASAVPFILLAGHSFSRLAPLLLMQRYTYARENDSKAAAAVYKPALVELIFAGVVALLPLLLLPWRCFLAVLPVIGVNYYLGSYFYRHIGGYTGDCLGASQQVAEVVFYLSVTALWTFI
ncbi:MAG: adenosylcobinamide-GDP ribazoletransferase [Methylococcales bacterium]